MGGCFEHETAFWKVRRRLQRLAVRYQGQTSWYLSRIDDLNALSKAISPQTDSPGVLENGHIARIRKSAILAAHKRLLYAVGGYDPRVIYRCTDRYSSNTTCMRNENEYIAVELQPKNVILAIFRRFNGHKAVGCIHSPASHFI